MRIFQNWATLLLLLLLPWTTFADLVSYTRLSGGGYAWTGHSRVNQDPSNQRLQNLAYEAYTEMVADCARRRYPQSRRPSTMSAAFYARGRAGGDILFHSSIKGGGTYTQDFVNSCDLGTHRFNGMCAEIANMVTGRRQGWSLSRVRIAVYGIINPRTGQTGFMSPCSDRVDDVRGDLTGCRSYVNQVDAVCVTSNRQNRNGKREALPEALPEAEPEAYADPEPEPEAKKGKPKPKQSKTKAVSQHSQTKASHHATSTGSSHATKTHSPHSTNSIHTSTRTSTAPTSSPTRPWSESCDLPAKLDPKLDVTIDESKIPKKATANQTMVSEKDIIAKYNQGFDTAKGIPEKSGGKGASATLGARSVQVPRRHLLEALGI